LLSSEKRSLFRFLAIYLTSTFLLFSLASWIFYTFSKHQLLDQQIETIKHEAQYIKSELRKLHFSDTKKIVYPKSNLVKSAIFDLDETYIFGTFKTTLNIPNNKDQLYHVINIKPYYLGAAYLMVKSDIDFKPIRELKKNIILLMLLVGLFFTSLGYFLGKLFIAPMRESMEQMNNFIQDTTHELNTPISTILTNIEMIEDLNKLPQNQPELKRIEIASKTLSRIHDDLTYLNLNHKYHREIVALSMHELVQERVLYFQALAEAKSLKISLNIEQNIVLNIDKNDALRLIDNLISNAIKYNKLNGNIYIILNKKLFSIEDTGVGIKKRDLANITTRFKRANKNEGGFGIGLDIVNKVIKTYGFTLTINSIYDIGTKVTITWGK
jgi:two-component system OmpR family sensor kinase